MAKENKKTESTKSEDANASRYLAGSQPAPAITNVHITQSKGRSVDSKDN